MVTEKIMSKPLVKSKLPNVGTTIFTVMTAEATKWGAINLAQGFPDFPCDSELIECVSDAMRKGHNQYAPMMGLLSLREELARLAQEHHKITYNADNEITITSGGTEALFAAISAVVQAGDEVIVFEPSYDSYVPAIELCGGIAIPIPLQFPNYSVDWEAVKQKITHKTKAIIINTPHNPTGRVLSFLDLEKLLSIIRERDIFVISDEVYEFITFDGIEHQSVMRIPALAERSFVIGSLGKTFHVTGWKIGYCYAPKELTTEFRKVHQFLTFATSHPFQFGIATYLKKYPQKPFELKQIYEEKRNQFLEILKATRFEPLPCEGSYFQTCSFKKITDEKDTNFVMKMTREFGVAAIPFSVFYQNEMDHKVIRFCFAKERDTLNKAGDKLCKI